MGAVLEARGELLQWRVAIKVLPEDVQEDHVAGERLRGEALAATARDHSFICKIHRLGETDGRLVVVMEFVEGKVILELIGRSQLPARQMARVRIRGLAE